MNLLVGIKVLGPPTLTARRLTFSLNSPNVLFLMSQQACLIVYFGSKHSSRMNTRSLQRAQTEGGPALPTFRDICLPQSFWKNYWLHNQAPPLAMWGSRHCVSLPLSPSSCPLHPPQTWIQSNRHFGFQSISSCLLCPPPIVENVFIGWPAYWVHPIGGNF